MRSALPAKYICALFSGRKVVRLGLPVFTRRRTANLECSKGRCTYGYLRSFERFQAVGALVPAIGRAKARLRCYHCIGTAGIRGQRQRFSETGPRIMPRRAVSTGHEPYCYTPTGILPLRVLSGSSRAALIRLWPRI